MKKIKICIQYCLFAALTLMLSYHKAKAQTLNINYIHSKLSTKDLEMFKRMARFEATFYNQVFHTTRNDSLVINVNLYGRTAEYNKVHKGINATLNSGFYSPFENKIFIYKSDQYINVLFHEASHDFLHYNMYNPPQWLNEGVATLMEHLVETTDNQILYEPAGTMIRQVRDSISKRTFNLNAFFSYHPEDWFNKDKEQMLYATSYAIVYFLINQQKDYLTPMLVAIQQGSSTKGAFIKSFGTLDNFVQKFYYFYVFGAGKGV